MAKFFLGEEKKLEGEKDKSLVEQQQECNNINKNRTETSLKSCDFCAYFLRKQGKTHPGEPSNYNHVYAYDKSGMALKSNRGTVLGVPSTPIMWLNALNDGNITNFGDMLAFYLKTIREEPELRTKGNLIEIDFHTGERGGQTVPHIYARAGFGNINWTQFKFKEVNYQEEIDINNGEYLLKIHKSKDIYMFSMNSNFNFLKDLDQERLHKLAHFVLNAMNCIKKNKG